MVKSFASFWRTNTVTVATVIIILAFGTILFLQAVATSEIQKSQQTDTQILAELQSDAAALKTITGNLAMNAATRTQQINQLSNQMNCIVLFFSSQNTDRTDKAISDINTCTITANGGKALTLSPTSSVQSTPPQTSNSGGTSNKTTTSGGVGSTTQPSTPSSPAPTNTPKPGFVSQVVTSIKNVLNGL